MREQPCARKSRSYCFALTLFLVNAFKDYEQFIKLLNLLRNWNAVVVRAFRR